VQGQGGTEKPKPLDASLQTVCSGLPGGANCTNALRLTEGAKVVLTDEANSCPSLLALNSNLEICEKP